MYLRFLCVSVSMALMIFMVFWQIGYPGCCCCCCCCYCCWCWCSCYCYCCCWLGRVQDSERQTLVPFFLYPKRLLQNKRWSCLFTTFTRRAKAQDSEQQTTTYRCRIFSSVRLWTNFGTIFDCSKIRNKRKLIAGWTNCSEVLVNCVLSNIEKITSLRVTTITLVGGRLLWIRGNFWTQNRIFITIITVDGVMDSISVIKKNLHQFFPNLIAISYTIARQHWTFWILFLPQQKTRVH